MKTTNNQLTLLQRVQSPTPKFFRVLRTIGIWMATVSTAAFAIPALPLIITQIAGYMALAGTVVTAVSQTAVDDSVKQEVTAPDVERINL
jgi:hypothetical protein